MNRHPFDRLQSLIAARRGAAPDGSYTARLLAKGPIAIAKKVGEEGVETALAGAAGSRQELAEESADLLYHLLVLWVARGLDPAEVWQVLARREALGGLEEKAKRTQS